MDRAAFLPFLAGDCVRPISQQRFAHSLERSNSTDRFTMQPVMIIGTLLLVVSASAANVFEVPFGQKHELQSPDGRHTLVLKRSADGAGQPPELWLASTSRREDHRILVVNRTARAEWAPDAKKFYVTEEAASDTTES